jgi:hypothetical protein
MWVVSKNNYITWIFSAHRKPLKIEYGGYVLVEFRPDPLFNDTFPRNRISIRMRIKTPKIHHLRFPAWTLPILILGTHIWFLFCAKVSGNLIMFSQDILPVIHRHSSFKGIDRPFGGGVESILIRSVFVNWRLGKFFYLILNGLHHKISKKLLYPA